jgi:hypothetical protein
MEEIPMNSGNPNDVLVPVLLVMFFSTFFSLIFFPERYRPETQVPTPAEEVLRQVEQVYWARGLEQTQDLCEDAGIFRQGNLFFRCWVNKGGSYKPPGRNFSTHTVGVVAFRSPAAIEGFDASEYIQRAVLPIP